MRNFIHISIRIMEDYGFINLSKIDHMSEVSVEDVEVTDVLKIVFLGDSGVGKTNIMSRFTHNGFDINTRPTLGVDFGIKTIGIGSRIFKLQLWDTAGQERYKSFTTTYFNDAVGLIVVYDITSPESFYNVDSWVKLALQSLDESDCKIMLLGNKIDLESDRAISTLEGQELANRLNMMFMEVSALDNRQECVGSALFKLVRSHIKRHSSSILSRASGGKQK